jgi:hypothetical protein
MMHCRDGIMVESSRLDIGSVFGGRPKAERLAPSNALQRSIRRRS